MAALASAIALHSLAPSSRAGPECAVDDSIDPQEHRLLQLINDYRAEHGLHRLVFSDALNRAAAWKSRDMATRNYFGHEDAGTSRGFVERLRDCGYTANAYMSENIAAGHSRADGTFDQWRALEGHNANMLSPNMVAIGIARWYSAGSDHAWYWTADFAGVADGYTPPLIALPQRSGDADCTGDTTSIDAALVLQFSAQMIQTLPCADEADVDANGRIEAVDATIILQLEGRMFG